MSRFAAVSVTAALALALTACDREPEPLVIAPTRLVADPDVAIIGTEARYAVLLPPDEPAGQRFSLRVPADPVLSFGFGLPDRYLAQAASAGTFEFALETAGGERTLIGGRRVDPAVQDDRRWYEARVDLGAWVGQELTLHIRLRPEPGERAPTGAIATPVISSASHRDPRPNVLIISIDTLRARSIGTYGYGRDTTPFIDALAERGTLFETAITSSVTTGPSHMSLLTGLYPVNHGMRSGKERKNAEVETLAWQLREAGYHTSAFTENGFIVRRFGFGQGFDEYTENRSTRREAPGETRVTFSQAERWILHRAREPFFVFVHTYQVHSPFWPPEPYAKLFEGDGFPGPDTEPMRRSRDNYDREIRYVDDEVRTLLSDLEREGRLDRTLVVFLSDHGEEFAEHGHFQHGGAVFEETLRIPLIFVGPGVAAGRRVASQVSLIDVTPTVLDLVGIPPSQGTDGISLADTLRGGAEPGPRTLFAEANAPKRWIRPFEGEDWNPPLIAVRSQHEKFVVHRPRQGTADPPARYDLAADALERTPHPVDGEGQRAVEELVDGYLKGRKGGAANPVEPLDADLRERLHALGYLDAEDDAMPEAPGS